ncbi:cell wall metabolism sensor histidine kinase WalK [Burkholderia sp. Bp9140]|uniref:sensor histidine kinase n=1 Tax=Burkholderia sp. Bp9140 TaxID=2184572 RepID=UPI001C894CC6|nr:ATP-binding protein [Burkholderia sp. Bp9140]
MSALAIAAVITIAFSMWLYFGIRDTLSLRYAPAHVRQEIELLRQHPRQNEARLRQLLPQIYDIDRLMPGLANPDWWMLIAMVSIAVPVIALCGLAASRPLSRQFSQVAAAAHRVSEGDFSARVDVIANAPGEFAGLAGDFNNMAARLQQYEREVRDSSAVLAHELRTPLNAAMGRVEGLLDEVFPLDAEQLELIKRQLEQINRLVGDLHLVSLARAGQLTLDMREFSLRDLIAERLEWAAPQLAAAGIAPVLRCTGEKLIVADRGRVGQVLTILIDNVLRYAASGKALEVDACGTPTTLVLAVSDRGPGVHPDEVHNMLDRFWRAERSRARHWGGSGLGLAIAAAICQRHGGELECSLRSGGGLVVTVRLPLLSTNQDV